MPLLTRGLRGGQPRACRTAARPSACLVALVVCVMLVPRSRASPPRRAADVGQRLPRLTKLSEEVVRAECPSATSRSGSSGRNGIRAIPPRSRRRSAPSPRTRASTAAAPRLRRSARGLRAPPPRRSRRREGAHPARSASSVAGSSPARSTTRARAASTARFGPEDELDDPLEHGAHLRRQGARRSRTA